MPRHPRVHAEGLLYHVMARGNDGQKIFLRESDYQAFIEVLRTVRQRYSFSLYVYDLMPNHFHLLLEVHRFPAEILLREARLGSVVSARDRFIREAVLQQDYLASQVASFLNCHPFNNSRPAKDLVDLGKSDTILTYLICLLALNRPYLKVLRRRRILNAERIRFESENFPRWEAARLGTSNMKPEESAETS